MKIPIPTLIEEEKLWRRGHALIGVDEVGMGPLAGPVVAVALMFKVKRKDDIQDIIELGVRDSKATTPKKRERLFEALSSHPSVRFGMGRVDEKTIDRINILEASLRAMHKAVEELFRKYTVPDEERMYAYIDGRNIIPNLSLNQKSIIDGDSKVFSIACASIIAKVLRDRLMCEYAKKHPQYQFEKHKGYGTKLHFSLLARHGLSPIHRRSFLKGLLASSVGAMVIVPGLDLGGREFKVGDYDIRLNERHDLGYCLQIIAFKEDHHFIMLFDSGAPVEECVEKFLRRAKIAFRRKVELRGNENKRKNHVVADSRENKRVAKKEKRDA